MLNRKSIELPRRRIEMAVEVADITIHLLFQRFDEAIHFNVRAFQNDFNPPIRKISHIAGHVVLEGKVLSGMPESHPLHAAAEMTSAAMNRQVGMNGCCVHRKTVYQKERKIIN